MKLTDFIIIFACIFITLITINTSKYHALESMVSEEIKYNNGIDNATYDALNMVVEYDSNRNIAIYKEQLVDYFFDNLTRYLSNSNNERLRQKLEYHVPVMAFILNDGVYYSYQSSKRMFSSLQPYVYDFDEYRIYFTLTDIILIENSITGKKEQGHYNDLSNDYDFTFLKDGNMFHELRKRIIIDTITYYLNYYVMEHNKIASKYGIKYEFNLPVISKDDWYRTIDNISLLVIFQGYPYSVSSNGTYNKVAIGASRLYKKNTYDIMEK